MIRAAWCVGAVALVGPLTAQSATGRWSLQVRSETHADRGDLRLLPDGARLLLESEDSAWLAIDALEFREDRVAFRVHGGRRFEGIVTGDVMAGEVTLADGRRARWEGRRIQEGVARWPVRPRVVVRQLVVGSTDTVARFPDALLERLQRPEALITEHARLATAAGFTPTSVAAMVAQAERRMLGFDPEARNAARTLLELISATPAADATFQGLFRTADGGWRTDLHDVAWQYARQALTHPIDPRTLGAALETAGLDAGVPGDSLGLRRAVWQLRTRLRNDATRAEAIVQSVAGDSAAATTLRALMAGYDTAEAWWVAAVQWLMHGRWLGGEGAWQSPVDLVSAFWEQGALALPPLVPQVFGVVQAVPVIGGGALAMRLLRPDNAIAGEWLAIEANRRDALDAWRRVDLSAGMPLRVRDGDSTMLVASAAWLARSRLGGFLASRDAIRIEPAIMPVFAVGTVIHEWQHLLFEAARLADPDAGAVVESPWGLQLVEGNPWLAEGAAEWATEAILGQESVPSLLALVEAEKRLAIGAGIPDDTHVLGYLLVRVGRNRTADAAELRRVLVSHLHDPVGFAGALGLATATHGAGFPRPATRVVIPEVRFTFDGGLADAPVPLLRVPSSAQER